MLVSFEEFIIIAEIKNIKFPMDPRDYHNAIKRLTEGVKQVSRKKKFIIDNEAYFSAKLNGVKGKKIYSLVICNYAHFTGLQIEDVPIVDCMTFNSYMNKGEMRNYRTKHNKAKGTPKTEEISVVKYWNNREEFFRNFEGFMKKPLMVESIKNNLVTKLQRINLPEFKPLIYVEDIELQEVKVEE